MAQKDYLIVWPDRPSPEEYRRGARLIPSMMDEGVLVWRVPLEPRQEVPETNAGGFTGTSLDGVKTWDQTQGSSS